MTSSAACWFLRHCHSRTQQLKGIPFKITKQDAIERFLHWSNSNPLGIRLEPRSLQLKTLHVPLFLFEADVHSEFEYEKTSMGRLFYQSLVSPRKTCHFGANYIRGTDNFRYTCGNVHMQLYAGPEPLLGASREIYIPANELLSLRDLTMGESLDAQKVCVKKELAERYFIKRICELERERIGKDAKQRITDVADGLLVQVWFDSKSLSCIYVPVHEISFCKSWRHFRYWMNGVTGLVSGDAIFSTIKTASYASGGCGLFCLLTGMTNIIPDMNVMQSFQLMGITYVVFGFLAHLMSASQWHRSGTKWVLESPLDQQAKGYQKKDSRSSRDSQYDDDEYSRQRDKSSSKKESSFHPPIRNTKQNYYDVLQVDPNSSMEDIKASFYRLVLKYHPDRFPGDESCAEKMKEILEAYSVLGNPLKRAMYDYSRKQQCSG